MPGLAAAEALEFPAIQLFVERAASVLGEFEVRDIDVPIVVDICRKLDDTADHRTRCRQHRCTWAPGSCLAAGSSLATADDPPPVGCAAAPYAAVLTGRELSSADRGRTVGIASLSVFAGSFTIDAAAAVTADRNYTKSETVDRVVALVAKSLVAVDADGSGTRLRLLATTRAYTLEKLAESGELDVIARRQAEAPQHSLRAAA